MLAGVATDIGAGAKNKIQRLGAILEMHQFVGQVAAGELVNRQLRVVWAVFDQQDFDFVFSIHSLSVLFWQGEIKCRACIEFGFRPDTSPVPVDDALDQGQAHTGSFKFIVAVQPLEDAKKFVGVSRIEPDAVVLDVKGVVFRIALSADFNHGGLPVPGEFDRVGEEIHKDLAH
jgi:hypothetical protein